LKKSSAKKANNIIIQIINSFLVEEPKQSKNISCTKEKIFAKPRVSV
jgi:hypothetical protein